MNLEDFIQVTRALTDVQAIVITDTAAALQRERYIIDTYGDGSELQKFNRYHQAVSRVNTAASPVYRLRTNELWKMRDAANTVQNKDARAALKNAGQAIVVADLIPRDVLDAVTAPLRAALGEDVSIPEPQDPDVPAETPAGIPERAARAPEGV